MDVSIILVNYNTSLLLHGCVSSVKEKTYGIDYEIIIVDNASSDESVSMIRRTFPDIKIIENEVNVGFGRANNQGAFIATGKYLLLLNTDTVLINNAIKVFYDFMEKIENQDIAVCGGNLYKVDGTPNFSYCLHFPSLFSIFCYRGHLPFLINSESFNKSGKNKFVAIIIGADLFIRKKVYDQLEGFDQSMFMYVEDGELSYRIHKLGYHIVSNPEAKIIHMQGASSMKIDKLKMEISSYIIYFRKHHGQASAEIYKLIESFFAFLRSLFFLFLFKKERSYEYFSLIFYIMRKRNISKSNKQ